jgi:pimeloyl-ACP methyl ester carboxylesterase
VAGESYGGCLAQGLASRRPARIEGMFLLCPLVHADPARRRAPEHIVLEREPGLLERLSDAGRAEFEPMAVIQTESTWEKFRRDILPALRVSDTAFLDRLWQGNSFADEAELERTRFEKPVLDRAGHNAQIEQPDPFEALARDWLKRVESHWT